MSLKGPREEEVRYLHLPSLQWPRGVQAGMGSEDEDALQVVVSASLIEDDLRQVASKSGEKEEAKMTTIDDLKVDEADYLMKFLTAEDVMALGTDLCQVARHLPTRVEKEET